MEPKSATQAVRLEQDGNIWRLANEFVGLRFDLSNYTYSVFLPATGEIVIENATLEGNRWAPSKRRGGICRQESMRVNDAAGRGMRVMFAIGFEHTPIPEYLFSFTL